MLNLVPKMKSLTICYFTSRGAEAKYEWFLESLNLQLSGRKVEIIKVDFDAPEYDGTQRFCISPKPTIWQGKYRQTREDWWAASSGRNTGICLTDTEWIAFVDDRCVLSPTWLDAVEAAMEGNYVMIGSYEKRRDMVVENGKIVDQGTKVSMDNRWEHVVEQSFTNPHRCGGNWVYGCSLALPLEWALQVGGFEEALDGMSAEDTAFGVMLQNNGFPICYDMRAHVVQDRTPGVGTKAFRREDKGKSPQDKSHRALELFGTACNTSNRYRLLQSRQAVQAGKPFPILLGDRECFWDAEPIGPNYMTLK